MASVYSGLILVLLHPQMHWFCITKLLHGYFSMCQGMESEYLCDTEVNMCYSSPCGANGTCIRHEGGYHCACPSDYTGKCWKSALLHIMTA